MIRWATPRNILKQILTKNRVSLKAFRRNNVHAAVWKAGCNFACVHTAKKCSHSQPGVRSPSPREYLSNGDALHMGTAIIRITDHPYTIIIRTGSKEPGLGKMATMSEGPPKSLELRLDYSPLPGSDAWKADVSGLLPVTQGKWEMDEDPEGGGNKAAILSGLGLGPFLYLRPYSGAGVFGSSWRSWPGNPFFKGFTGTGGRIGSRTGSLNPQFHWQCLSDD
jgi:hypothetical protein